MELTSQGRGLFWKTRLPESLRKYDRSRHSCPSCQIWAQTWSRRWKTLQVLRCGYGVTQPIPFLPEMSMRIWMGGHSSANRKRNHAIATPGSGVRCTFQATRHSSLYQGDLGLPSFIMNLPWIRSVVTRSIWPQTSVSWEGFRARFGCQTLPYFLHTTSFSFDWIHRHATKQYPGCFKRYFISLSE